MPADGAGPSQPEALPLSYRSPKTVVAPSAIHGRGLFAAASIAKDEVVAVKGGAIVNREALARLTPRFGPAEIQIGEDLFICPTREEDRDGSIIRSNHSFDPNVRRTAPSPMAPPAPSPSTRWAAATWPAPDGSGSHAMVIWRITRGDGRFAGAQGLITSNFTVSPDGQVVDDHFARLYPPTDGILAAVFDAS